MAGAVMSRCGLSLVVAGAVKITLVDHRSGDQLKQLCDSDGRRRLAGRVPAPFPASNGNLCYIATS